MSTVVWSPEAGWHDGLTATLAIDSAGRIRAEVLAAIRPGCSWDSGSATGCRPTCDAPATHAVTHEGYRGPYVWHLCARHAVAVPARIYPSLVLAVSAR